MKNVFFLIALSLSLPVLACSPAPAAYIQAGLFSAAFQAPEFHAELGRVVRGRFGDTITSVGLNGSNVVVGLSSGCQLTVKFEFTRPTRPGLCPTRKMAGVESDCR